MKQPAPSKPTHFRSRFARALVRWVSRWHDAAYAANCREAHSEAFWAAGARRAQRLAFPIARRLDREAMADQMIEECWWG